MDFLPKGEGMVTRSPLELRLQNSQVHSTRIQLWIKGQEDKKQDVDLTEVSGKITELTKQILDAEFPGRREDELLVSHTPIIMKYQSDQVPNLTLIDLPGLVTHDKDIEQHITDLLNSYIEKPDTIIVAVLNAA
mmetsp:Transcript_20442/g.17795  ORF Transcript_20442/g.17795 Transcript_20442/m.17795 type:complete len:134 (-) Transcript_20442:719-1120(-)